ncbi:NAD(P)-dependent oxidoreductase [Allosphingosinicella deserti]|uniref:NAD(P)-dependent oxidoreductase n=1 Tax=Allosphingosinicella deserti TaxID=2116704 RepID=A0A2P7QVQ3_9SPHN|nr:NAD(P)-dependent oxidoreductase [Sphingomonas deserti]PSJ42055.1 NAD(P)-dependent oxidoreductase [Sphingomonas deserti]
MAHTVTLIGFGEAGQAFAGAPGWTGSVRAYDRLTDDPATRAAKEADYRRAGVDGAASLAEAMLGAACVLSLVTADQALAVARDAAPPIGPGTLFCDLNSVSPGTKRQAAAAIEAAGGCYVDVAVMAPVHPARLAVPLLLSGREAPAAARALAGLGFANVRVVGTKVGEASSIKMIRSVIVKGLEALTAEAMLAAEAAGVTGEVLASLDASDKLRPWAERADYNLDRMLVHGRRRADELEEVVKTLADLGVDPAMSRATAVRQRALGSLGIAPAPAGLAAKIATITDRKADAA